MATIPLSSEEVHVWVRSSDEILDPVVQGDMTALLSSEERDRMGRFHFAKDRDRYLVTRSLARNVLSQYVGIPPADWRFSTTRYGRPEIANLEPGPRGLEFNLSHTDGMVVMGVSKARALGIDVENVATRDVSLHLAERYFAPKEAASLHSVPVDERKFRFFEYWTFKESYIKARGMGLHLPLDKFSFDFPAAGEVLLDIEPELSDTAVRWLFWQFRVGKDFLVALCAEKSGSRAPRVTVKQVNAEGCEKALATCFMRISK